MKLLYFLAIIVLVLLSISLYNVERFKSIAVQVGDDGVPEGEPRIRQVVVNMADHTTVATIMHGTVDKFIILVHGYPLTQETWYPLLEELSVQARNGVQVPTVITYDLRGCGFAIEPPIDKQYLNSNVDNIEWTLNLFADDLYRIYKEIIGIRGGSTRKIYSTVSNVRPLAARARGLGERAAPRIGIGGWAFGGCVAQKFALQYPNVVSDLFLFSTLGVAVSEVIPDIQHLSKYALTMQVSSLLTLPTSFVNKTLCEWFNVEDVTVCNGSTDLKNDVGTFAYETAQAILTVASNSAQIQVLKIVSSLDLISRWGDSPAITYNVTFVAPINDTVTPPNQILKIYSAIKKKYKGVQQPAMLTPEGKHYYCLQNPHIVMSVILGSV